LEHVFRQDLCAGHFKRLQRGQPINSPLGTGRVQEVVWVQAHEAVITYQDSDSDEEQERNLDTLIDALKAWSRAGFPRPSRVRLVSRAG
jgi:hypothetical protein